MVTGLRAAERVPVTKQTWTATVSAVLFVVLAAVIALVPVPFVTWSPGATHDLLGKVDGNDVITITGAPTYQTTGQALMTTVAVTAPESAVSLPEAFFAYWLPAREVLPRVAVYREGDNPTEINQGESQMMTDSQSEAVVAALRQAGIQVRTWPMVESVTASGPANEILKPGDLIQSVTAKGETNTASSIQVVQDAIARAGVGLPVDFGVLRDGQEVKATVTTRATTANPDKPVIGVALTSGYTYGPKVSFAVDPAVGGSSAGLMFALAIADKLTSEDLIGDRVVAGTGTIAADGTVGAIGGVQEKIAGAVRDGASIFLLPRKNCVDVGTPPAGIRLVPVDSLSEAVDALNALSNTQAADSVASCG